jgi:hypothetical protein
VQQWRKPIDTLSKAGRAFDVSERGGGLSNLCSFAAALYCLALAASHAAKSWRQLFLPIALPGRPMCFF